MSLFLILAFFTAIFLSNKTHSLPGVLVGESIVCLTASMYSWNQGNWGLALGAGFLSLVCVLLAVTSNGIKLVSVATYNEHGKIAGGTQFILGEGAKQETVINLPNTYVIRPQDIKFIGDK